MSYKHNSSSCIITKLISRDIIKIFEFIPFGIALYDINKRLIYHNTTLQTILNATYKDNMHDIIVSLTTYKQKFKKSSTFCPNALPIKESPIIRLIELIQKEDVEQHCEVQCGEKNIWVKAKLIHLNEETMHIVTFADVTLQKQCEMLKEINKLKTKILSSLSHEFRNPLHNILDSLTNCQKEPKELLQDIRIANSNANFMLYKVNDLLVLFYTGLFAN